MFSPAMIDGILAQLRAFNDRTLRRDIQKKPGAVAKLVAKPINIYVNTYGRSNVPMTDGEIANKISEIFDMRPKAIEDRLKLRNPIYQETAAYGHMGREDLGVAWEKRDLVELPYYNKAPPPLHLAP